MDKGRREETTWWRCGGRSASGSSASRATGSSSWRTRRAQRTPTTGRPSRTGIRRGPPSGPTPSNANSHPTASAPFWRGATRRCTTARCGSSTRWLERVEIDYDVIPGITAIQALTARHRIPLNDIGEPVLITTGRRLATDGFDGQRRRDARRRLRVPVLPAANPNLVGRLPGHAGRAAGVGHRRRGRRADRRSCAPRRVRATAGSWTPICCEPRSGYSPLVYPPCVSLVAAVTGIRR